VRLPEQRTTAPLKMVASGVYAHVYSYIDTVYGIPFALRRAKRGLSEKDLVRFRNEFDLMKKIKHPYILRVFR
jgi:eukaryotic-like serine/threonine-protein kinase